MDDEEWDLHAVVRSCTTIGGVRPAAAGGNNDTTTSRPTTVEDYDDGTYNLESLAASEENPPFAYSSFGGGLEDVYKAAGRSSSQSHEQTTTTTNNNIIDVVVDGDDQGFLRQQLPMLTDSHHSFSMHAMNSSNSTRPRKRKNQEKTVFQLTQEDLSNDLWAWRKYGQKPIKGSPFPRNYYRCSTTKACGAKKQVERSPVDPTIFIVSYSGEHIHPRPTHRSSLAGSTRSNKFSITNTVDQSSNKPPLIIEHPPPCSSSSPASTSSFSPTTSFKDDECEINDDEPAPYNNIDHNILKPNMILHDQLLKRFRDLNSSGGGGAQS